MQGSPGVNVLSVCMLMTVVLTLFACGNDKIEREIRDFTSSDITIPVDKMLELHCSASTDPIDACPLLIVDYEEVKSCSNCVAAKIASSERDAFSCESDDVFGVLHIIRVKAEDSILIYKSLCRERVRGIVLLDTCDAFLAANPQFPSSPLLHAFVMDMHGKVLLVGNPFNGKKIKSLFDRIVEEHRLVIDRQNR